MPQPLMPKATAVWLLDNTVLTFEQIADFCDLHLLEVKGIADGDVARGIRGADPIAAGQLTRAEIENCQEDPDKKLHGIEKKEDLPKAERRVGKKYTPFQKDKTVQMQFFGLLEIIQNFSMHKYQGL